MEVIFDTVLISDSNKHFFLFALYSNKLHVDVVC